MDPIDAFWDWWSRNSRAIADDIDANDSDKWVEPLTERLRAINSELAWEFGPGHQSRHHFAISAEGDIQLRVVTERTVSRAPRADGDWEYFAAKQPMPEVALTLSLEDVGAVIDFKDFAFATELVEVRERLNLTAYNPTFAELPEDQQVRATFIVLDNLLGEDDVERWLQGIGTSTEPLPDAVDLAGLREAVGQLAQDATGESYAILEKQTDDGALTAVANLAVKRVDHLLFDVHLEVTIPLARDSADETEVEILNDLEETLTAHLGDEAVFIAHETGCGQRVAHYHIASTGPAETRARTWARNNAEYNIDITVRSDPSWEILRRF